MNAVNVDQENGELRLALLTKQAQLNGLQSRVNDLARVNSQGIDPQLIWRQNGEDPIENQFQSWVLQRLLENEQSVFQYVQTPRVMEIDHEHIGFAVEFSGEQKGMLKFLTQVKDHRPAIAIASLQTRPVSQREQIAGQIQISTQITLWGLSAPSDD